MRIYFALLALVASFMLFISHATAAVSIEQFPLESGQIF